MDRGQHPSARRRRLPAVIASVAVHLLVLSALLSARTHPPRAPEAAATPAVLVELLPPVRPVAPTPRPPSPAPPSPAPPAAAPPAPVKPLPAKPPPPNLAKPRPPRPAPDPVPARQGPSADTAGEVSDTQLASAATAGSGSGSGAGGGGCDMTRWLQAALRKDRLVQAAVAAAPPGKAIMVWNGDWVRRADQDGAGLAAVREAMMWEIAFAPQPCRTKPVHGLVLISLADGPGGARLVVGAGDWRWSDLLQARGVRR